MLVFLHVARVVHVGVRVRLATVRVGVLVLDVVVRVCPVRMRVGRLTVAVLVAVHFVGHAPDAGTSLTSAQWCKVLLVATSLPLADETVRLSARLPR
jgi:hypothetical protein